MNPPATGTAAKAKAASKKQSVTRDKLDAVREHIASRVIGQQQLVDGMLVCLLSDGHLLVEGMPLLFVAAVIGTLGTILSVYKLLHNTFLGQLRLEHEQIREVPWSMMIPMLILSLIVFITGFMPGIVLDWVATAQAAMGLPQLAHSLGGVESAQGGLDMIWVVSILLGGFGVGAAAEESVDLQVVGRIDPPEALIRGGVFEGRSSNHVTRRLSATPAFLTGFPFSTIRKKAVRSRSVPDSYW